MILASKIETAIRSALDAEGSDYYKEVEDILPAINYSVHFVVSVINAALGQKKIGEEIFRDLSQARVFRTSIDSRISFDDFPDEVWTVTGVFPLPETGNTGAAVPSMTDDKKSYLRVDKYHKNSQFAAKRLNIDEWTTNRNNPYAAGYDKSVVCPELRLYAYLNPVTYNPDSSVSIAHELEVRPALSKELITVFYIQKPGEITALTDSVPFPEAVMEMLVNKALFWIAYKQGDQTTLATMSQADINQLASLIA